MRSAREPPRAIVDTNLIVSGTIIKRGKPFDLLRAWRSRQFVLLMGQEQRQELDRVLSRPKIYRKYDVSPTEIAELFRSFNRVILRTTRKQILPVSVRDTKDETILASALGGNADYLVTGDNDLLVLRDEPLLVGVKIVTVREFLLILTSESVGENRDD